MSANDLITQVPPLEEMLELEMQQRQRDWSKFLEENGTPEDQIRLGTLWKTTTDRARYKRARRLELGEMARKQFLASQRLRDPNETANEHRARLRAAKARRKRVMGLYGLSPSQHRPLHIAGACAICNVELTDDKRSPARRCIDHDHATGRVRGVLCVLCNQGLGHFRDNPEFLSAAINYLQKRGRNLSGNQTPQTP